MWTDREIERLDRAIERIRSDAASIPAPPWGGFADVEARRRRRRRAATVRATAGLLAAACLAVIAWAVVPAGVSGDGDGTARSTPVATAPTPGAAEPDRRGPDPGGDVGAGVSYVAEPGAVVREMSERIFVVEIGTVWFAVEPGGGEVRVRTPDREIVVHGTVFAVSVRDGARGGSRIGVLTGRVEVRGGGGESVFVEAGAELAPFARTTAPLDPAWRDRLAALFPERVGAETRRLEAAAPGEPIVPGSGSHAGSPVAAAEPGGGTNAAAAAPPPNGPSRPSGTAAPPQHLPARPAAERYRAVEQMMRAGNAQAAAEELATIARSSEDDSEAGLALMELGRLCRRRLHDVGRAYDVYAEYLRRFPTGPLREDARIATCEILHARRDLDGEKACLRAYVAEFPHGSRAADSRARIERMARDPARAAGTPGSTTRTP